MRFLLPVTWALALGLSGTAAAAPLSFQAHSLADIRAQYHGRPFVLALWSLSCSHCARELAEFSALKKKYPHFNLVLIATDAPDDAAAIDATLDGLGLAGVDSWVYADHFTERLRHAIDPHWGGELPRTYLYDATHRARAITGRLPPGALDVWLRPSLPALAP